MKKIKRWILCHILGHHHWTSDRIQNVDPTDEQIQMGVTGFWDYSRLFCLHCGKTSKVYKNAQGRVDKLRKQATLKKMFIILLVIININAFGQSISNYKRDSIVRIWWDNREIRFNVYTDTVISKAQLHHTLIEQQRNQVLYAVVCNILQYITTDGKITDKKAFAAAVKFYLNYLKQNPNVR